MSDRKTRREIEAASVRDNDQCGICKQPYARLEHTYIGRVGSRVVVSCDHCFPKLTEMLGMGIAAANVDTSSAEYRAAFLSHPLQARIPRTGGI